MNKEIQEIFSDFIVDGQEIPVEFLRYGGKAETYVTYQQIDADNTLSADDELENYVIFYDFDVYSKYNYIAIVNAIKSLLKANGWRWQPTRSSGDMFEDDTGYYHITLNFSIEKGDE